MDETVSTIPSVVGTTPGVLRLMNSRAILDELLRDDASRTVTELSRTVGLSRPTVEAALADLVDEGWVTEAEAIATPNKAGRRAKRFAADATAGSVLGVDLGLHGIVGIRADLRGNTLTRVEERYADLADAEQAWTSVQDVVRRLTADSEASPVLAATFGVPAVVDRAGEIDYTVAVPEWVERRVPGRIQDLFPGIATFFDNDAKLAATAEAMWGRFRGVQDGLYLVMGRQIGAAYVIDGALARGARGAAGEMGGLASTGWPGAPARLEARIASDTDLESVFAAAGRGAQRRVASARTTRTRRRSRSSAPSRTTWHRASCSSSRRSTPRSWSSGARSCRRLRCSPRRSPRWSRPSSGTPSRSSRRRSVVTPSPAVPSRGR